MQEPAGPAALPEGWNDLSAGMDSSRSPEVLAPLSYALGVNIVARDGMPQTRPMLRRVELQLPAAYRTGFFQGAAAYYNPTSGLKQVLAMVGGHLYAIDPLAGTIRDLSTLAAFQNDATAEHYFIQAESYLVVQNGKDAPLIFNGLTIRRATADEIPTGSMMAYGQGRIFLVSADFRAVLACDLVYGGSTMAVAIYNSVPATGFTTLTTTTPHGYATGNTVTITGHSSSPTLNGTWIVTVTGATTFTIPTTITTGGSGGISSRANDGLESDVLRNTESQFNNEKGIFRLPAWMGKITCLMFFPVQDTGTGQGDLLVGGEHGAVTFRVSAPRDTWLNIQIQRVALTEIGFVGHRAACQINGDIFFGSWDGIRSYRNARAEFGNYAHTPLSAEMTRVFSAMGRYPMTKASMAFFDNRALYTTSPRMLPATDSTTPPRVIFQSLTALDFQQSSRITKGNPAYDGIWTGLDLLQIIPCKFGPDERFYGFAWQLNNEGARNIELWELTQETTGYDEWRNCAGTLFQSPIKCVLETRAFGLNAVDSLKRLARLDLWLTKIRGDVSFRVYWRPDCNPAGWFHWKSFVQDQSDCATNQPADGHCYVPGIRPALIVPQLKLPTPPVYKDGLTERPAHVGYSFQLRIEWDGLAQIQKGKIYGAQIVEQIQGDGLQEFTTESGTFPKLKQFSGYTVNPAKECDEGTGACTDFATVLSSPPETLDFLLLNNGGSVTWAAGEHILASLGSGSWFVNLLNAGYTSSIKLTVDPALNHFDMTITPNVATPTVYYLGVTATESCFEEPVTAHTNDFHHV